MRRAHRASAFGTVALAATVGACGGPPPPGGSDHPGDIGVVNGGGAIEDLEGGGHIEGAPGGPVHDGSAPDSDGATSSESGSTGSVESPGGGTNLGGNGTGDAGGVASSGSGSTGSSGSGAAGGYQGGNSVAAPGAFGDGGVGGLVLTIVGNVNLTSLDWTIQGMVTYRGSIAVDGAETIDGDKRIVWLVAVQAGDGYAVSVSATDTNGDRCVGSSAPLNVEAGMVTNAFVTVTCGRAASLETGDGAVGASDG